MRSPLANFLFHLQLGIWPITRADSEQNKSLLIGAPSHVTLNQQVLYYFKAVLSGQCFEKMKPTVNEHR